MEGDSRDRSLSGAESASGGEDMDITIDHEAEKEEQSDSNSEGATSFPQTGTKERGRNRKNTNHISYSDFSYLNSLPRQKRRRIEGELIKRRKVG
jgi:hypothetical protein